MTKTKKLGKETPKEEEVNVPEVVETPVVEEEVVPESAVKDFKENGGFNIEVRPKDSLAVKRAKTKAIFAAEKRDNPKRYELKNKEAELEKKLKALK